MELPANLPVANKNWKTDPRYLAIKAISNSDLLNGRNGVEKLKGGVCAKKVENSSNQMKPAANSFNFGKHKSKTYEEVKRDDPRYFAWCQENVKNFKG